MTLDDGPQNGYPVRRASVADTLRIAATVLGPTLASGVIVRRPRVLALAERLDTGRLAIRLLQRLRARYGPGPLRLAVPFRPMAFLLSPEDTHRVLADAPEPFTPANREKRAALAHFQPHGALISDGQERQERRRFSETVLEMDHPVHDLAPALVPAIREEARSVALISASTGELTWKEFEPAWWRTVRRITFGYAAREDQELIALLSRLRKAANWAGLAPARPRLQEDFLHRLRGHLDRAEPGSLAARIAATPATGRTRPEHQVAHWLFAFDAVGMATFRTLALLATHPGEAKRVYAELDALDLSETHELPYLRACVHESLRLWPTSPLILRDTTQVTEWGEGTSLPVGTALVIYTPFLHRDGRTLPYADRFAPGIWQDGRAYQDWSLVPFSTGPGECPGRSLVLFTTSTLLGALLEHHRFLPALPWRLDPDRPLPGTLSPFSLRFAVSGRS